MRLAVRRSVARLSVVALWGVIACEFDEKVGDLPDAGPASSAADEEFRLACEGLATRAERCGEAETRAQQCPAAEACFRSVLRDDAEHAILSCLADGRCGEDCTAATAATLELTPISAAHVQRCSTWSCTGLEVRSDLCRDRDSGAPHWSVFDDALFEAVAPCFERPCAEFDACVEAQLASAFPACTGLGGACEAGPLQSSAGLVTSCYAAQLPAPSIILLRAVDGAIVDVASGITVVNKGVELDAASARFDTSFRFEGGTSRLTIPDNPMLDFQTRDFTVELWFYPVVSGTLIAKRANGRSYGAFDFFGDIGLYVSSAGGHWDVAYAMPYGWEYRWQHVAMVRHGPHIFVYHDGHLLTTLDIGERAIMTVPNDLSIGNELDSSYPFLGNMEELRIVDGFAVYDGDFAPPAEPFRTP